MIESAVKLQQVVPDAVLVGGTAAALYASHRESFDHDHVLTDLAQRYEQILEAVEATDGWATSVRASRPPMTLMGTLGGIEAGLRQLRRTHALEVAEVEIPRAGRLQIPTLHEMVRVKAYLVVQRNQVRDYLDVVALADRIGIDESAAVLASIDEYYDDRSRGVDSVVTALVQRLAEPNPRDSAVTKQLAAYKGLDANWHQWGTVRAACLELAHAIVEARS